MTTTERLNCTEELHYIPPLPSPDPPTQFNTYISTKHPPTSLLAINSSLPSPIQFEKYEPLLITHTFTTDEDFTEYNIGGSLASLILSLYEENCKLKLQLGDK